MYYSNASNFYVTSRDKAGFLLALKRPYYVRKNVENVQYCQCDCP